MLYPRRVAKKAAERAWAHLKTEQKRDAMIALPRHIRWWSEKCDDIATVPHPASWINGDRWTDDLGLKKVEAPARAAVVPVPVVETPRSDAAVAMRTIGRMKDILASR